MDPPIPDDACRVPTSGRAAAHRIRARIERNEMEQALSELQTVIDRFAPHLANDRILIVRELREVEEAERKGTLTHEDAHTAKSKNADQLLKLLDALGRPLQPLSAADERAR